MRILFLSFLFFLFGVSAAVAKRPTVEQSIPQAVLQDKRNNIITVVLENDAFADGKDRDYSSGARLSYIDVGSNDSALARILSNIVPGFHIKKTTALYYSLGHNIYTPRNVSAEEIGPHDRPWAAFLYGSLGLVNLKGDHMDELEATAGIVGPAALGKQIQRFVHKNITDSPKPRGWDRQLRNEPGAMLAWQRSWPMLIYGEIGNNFWSFKPYGGATVGNIYTYGDIGVSFRYSPSESKWQDTPARVRPAMPGTGIYEIPKNKWSWALFGGLEGRAVARNIFLDGNTFAHSYSIDKKPFVADATMGAALTYQNFRFSYTAVYRTKEYDGQAHPEIFGALSGSMRF